jgi:hypothetical protein
MKWLCSTVFEFEVSCCCTSELGACSDFVSSILLCREVFVLVIRLVLVLVLRGTGSLLLACFAMKVISPRFLDAYFMYLLKSQPTSQPNSQRAKETQEVWCLG